MDTFDDCMLKRVPLSYKNPFSKYCAVNIICLGTLSQDTQFPPPVSSYFNVEATPEDMAEYIFFTKDFKSVTQAIEKLIQDGRVSTTAVTIIIYILNVYSILALVSSKDARLLCFFF